MEDEADINASIDSFVPDGQQENSQWLPRPWTIVKVRNLRLNFKSKQISTIPCRKMGVNFKSGAELEILIY